MLNESLKIVFLCWISSILTSTGAAASAQRLDEWRVCPAPEGIISDCLPYQPGQDLHADLRWNANEAVFESVVSAEQPCARDETCWLFVGEFADAGEIWINESKLAHFDSYVRNQSWLLPLPLLPGAEFRIRIKAKDLDGAIFGLRSRQISIGHYADLRFLPVRDYMVRTGPSVLSAFTLLLFGIALILGARLTRDWRMDWLAAYSLGTSIYHLSFAEIGRQLLYPPLAAGPVHFSLRLLQDLLLLNTLFAYFGRRRRDFILATIVYGLAIGLLWSLWLWGFHELRVYLKAMYIMAPLVAFPITVGVLLFRNSKQKFERSWIFPAFAVLLVMQANDLLVFWQIYRGVFFIRWYPAFIVVILSLGLLRRSLFQFEVLQREAAAGLVAARFSHDIRAPLAALRVALTSLRKQDIEAGELATGAMERLESITHDVLDTVRSDSHRSLIEDLWVKISLRTLFTELFKSTLYATHIDHESNVVKFDLPGSDLEISIKTSMKVEFERAICNLLSNAIEASLASRTESARIRVQYGEKSPGRVAKWMGARRKVTIEVTNSGLPIEEKIATMLVEGQRGVTHGKEHGNGIGFWSVRQTLIRMGGTANIRPDRSFPGTRVALKFPSE